jgi:hypothetical protein
MNVAAIADLNRAFVRASLRSLGVEPRAIWIVAVVVFGLDVRAALSLREPFLVTAAPVAVQACLVGLACLVLSAAVLFSPRIDLRDWATPEERTMFGVAGIDPKSAVLASLVRRVIGLAGPIVVLAFAAAFSPLDPTLALTVATLISCATLSSVALKVVMPAATRDWRFRVVVSSMLAAIGLVLVVLVRNVPMTARSISTLARRRLSRSGVRGGSGIVEFLEAFPAVCIAALPVVATLGFGMWHLAGVCVAALVALCALSVVERSVATMGPGAPYRQSGLKRVNPDIWVAATTSRV